MVNRSSPKGSLSACGAPVAMALYVAVSVAGSLLALVAGLLVVALAGVIGVSAFVGRARAGARQFVVVTLDERHEVVGVFGPYPSRAAAAEAAGRHGGTDWTVTWLEGREELPRG